MQKTQEGATWEMIYKERAAKTQEDQGEIGKEHGHLGKEHGQKGGRGKKKTPLVELVPQGGFPPPLQQPLTQPNEETIEEPVSQHVQEPPPTPQVPVQPKKKERAPRTRDKVATQVGLGSGKNYENAKAAVEVANYRAF